MENPHLFQLIKSLNQAEKRYFKLFATAFTDDTNYVRLFDLINQQKSYNEEELKKTFEGQKIAKQFNVFKFYLVKLIMRSLRLFHEEDRDTDVLMNGIKNVDILMQKVLLAKANKEIQRLKKKALQIEQHLLHREILTREKQLMLLNNDLKRAKKITQEEEDIIAIIDIEKRYKYFASKTNFLISKKNFKRYPKVLVQLEELRDEIEQEQYDKLPTESLKLSYLFSLSTCYYAEDNLKKATQLLRKRQELFEANNFLIEKLPLGYVSTLNNLSSLYINQKQGNDFINVNQKLKILPEKHKVFTSMRMIQYTTINAILSISDYYNNIGDFAKSVALEPQAINLFENKQLMIPNIDKAVMFNHLAQAYFGIEDFSKALEYNNKSINLLDSNHKTMLSAFISFHLLVHFELGNDIIIPSIARSSKRVIKKQNAHYQIEQALAKSIEKISSIVDLNKKRIEFEKLEESLKCIAADAREIKALDEFPYLIWIESKITGKSFSQLVQASSKVNN